MYFLPNKGCRYLAVFKVMVWVHVVYCEHVRVPLTRPDTDRSSNVLSGSVMLVDRHTSCQALSCWQIVTYVVMLCLVGRSSYVLSGSVMLVDRHTLCQALSCWQIVTRVVRLCHVGRSSHVLSGSAMLVDRHTCCQALSC